MNRAKFRVCLVEPSQIVARGLCDIIDSSDLFEVVGTFADLTSFEGRVPRALDIVILNPTLVVHARRGALRALFDQARMVAVLYNYVDRETLAQFDHVIDIYDKPSKILHQLEQATTHEHQGKQTSDSGELSDREKEILIAVAKGMINKEIADLYNISIHTVIAHRKNISRKTGIKSVSGFVVYALLNNFIDEYEVL